MLRQRVRQVGGSAVVTIPKEDLERLGIAVGDLVAFEPTKVEVIERHILPDETEELIDTFWDRPGFQRALDYLKDR